MVADIDQTQPSTGHADIETRQITLSFDLNSSSVMSAVAKVAGSNPSSPISAPLALSIPDSNLIMRDFFPPAHI